MNKYTKNLIIIFIMISSLLVFGGFSLARAENRSENVKNTISAVAISGENTISGSGTIKTGDASATVEAKNYLNGGENIENKAEAKAETQGGGGTASVSVNGEEKSCTAENGESCEVEIENSSASVGESTAEIKGEETDKNMAEEAENIFLRIAKKFIDKIEKWFG